MNEVNYNSNEVCRHLYFHLLALEAVNKSLLEAFLSTIQARGSESDAEKMREVVRVSAKVYHEHLGKSYPLYDEVQAQAGLDYLKSFLEGGGQ